MTHDRFEALALSDDVVVMQAGNVVQRGTPEDVYFRSNTRFVVDFMGKANFLEATVTGTSPDGLTLVDSSVGPLQCEPATDVAPGDSGMVAVRMEFIQVLPVDRPAELPTNHAVGTVTAVVFSLRDPRGSQAAREADAARPSTRSLVSAKTCSLLHPSAAGFITA